MKNFIKLILQKFLGFENYLQFFSLFKFWTLQWDSQEKDFFYFLKLIPEKGIILDIGANIGFIAITISKKRNHSIVHAFEPISQNFSVLKKMVSFFNINNIATHNYALGNKNEDIEMMLPVRNGVKMQGLSHVKDEKNKNENGIVLKAKMKKLDDLQELFENNQIVTAIKMDVENFEYQVLAGGQQLIKKSRPLIFTELWNNENRVKCIGLIKTMNYEVKVLHKNQLENYDDKKHITQQFFFIPLAQ